MKRNKLFTLIELLVVIVIIGILITLVGKGLGSASGSANALKSQNNLKSIGNAIQSYAMKITPNYIPVEVDPYDPATGETTAEWKTAIDADVRLSTACMQQLRVSSAGKDLDIETYQSPIASCTKPTLDVNALDGYVAFDAANNNVGFHLINGRADLRLYRNKALMRDRNMGHESNEYGFVLMQGGTIRRVISLGDRDPATNLFATPWFDREEEFSNAGDFDGFNGSLDDDSVD